MCCFANKTNSLCLVINRCGNVAAILELDENLKRDFTIFEAAPNVSILLSLSLSCMQMYMYLRLIHTTNVKSTVHSLCTSSWNTVQAHNILVSSIGSAWRAYQETDPRVFLIMSDTYTHAERVQLLPSLSLIIIIIIIIIIIYTQSTCSLWFLCV